MNLKAQLSIEFIVMLSTAIALVTLFLWLGNDLFLEKSQYQQGVALRDAGYTIQSEIILAAKSEIGYSRTFQVPQVIDSMNYTLKSTKNAFYISYGKHLFTYFIPEIEGNITKGNNNITTNTTSIIVRH